MEGCGGSQSSTGERCLWQSLKHSLGWDSASVLGLLSGSLPVGDHRPIDLFWLEKTSKIQKSNYQPMFTKPCSQEP